MGLRPAFWEIGTDMQGSYELRGMIKVDNPTKFVMLFPVHIDLIWQVKDGKGRYYEVPNLDCMRKPEDRWFLAKLFDLQPHGEVQRALAFAWQPASSPTTITLTFVNKFFVPGTWTLKVQIRQKTVTALGKWSAQFGENFTTLGAQLTRLDDRCALHIGPTKRQYFYKVADLEWESRLNVYQEP